MKTILFSLLLLIPLSVYAQTGTSSAPQATSTAPVSTTAVASINVGNATSTKNGTTTYAVSFSIFNAGETQKGVKYVLALTEKDGTIVYTQTYDAELAIEKDKTVFVNETFNTPRGLNGTYTILVRVMTATGLPLGTAFAGEITFKDTELLSLTSCMADQKSYDRNQILKVTCDVREIKKGALQSKEFEGFLVSGRVFYNNEPKEQQVALAQIKDGKAVLEIWGLSTPGTYTVRATIMGRTGIPVDKEASALFEIHGTSVSVLNMLLNKDMYQKGENALASISINTVSSGTTSPLTIVRSLIGKNGPCAASSSEPLENKNALQLSIPVASDCLDPKLYIEIRDQMDAVLATSTLIYTSKVREDAIKNPKPSITSQDKMLYGGIGGAGLLVGAISVFFISRKRKMLGQVVEGGAAVASFTPPTPPTPPTTPAQVAPAPAPVPPTPPTPPAPPENPVATPTPESSPSSAPSPAPQTGA